MNFAAALQAVGATAAHAAEVLEPLKAACALYDISTPQRLAAFLAQTGHESEGFRYASELWGPTPAQKRYEGRADLGNTQPGDGERFKGHGFIQTTGRANHAKVRDRLRERLSIDVPDFEQEPDQLAQVQWACLSAADYWDMKALNPLADAGDFIGITRNVNGGLNGQPDRVARWEKAKAALGIGTPAIRIKELPLVQLGPEPPADSQEPDMPPFLVALLPSLISAVPELAKMFGSGSAVSERNIKAAEVLATVAKDALGAKNEQEVVEQMQADPAAVSKVRDAIKDNWYQLVEVGGGIEAAREASIKMQGDRGVWANPAMWISAVLLVFPLMLCVDVFYVHPTMYDANLRTQIVTAILGTILAVGAFWLGSSRGSQMKDEAKGA